jgi:hypothetical protein
LEEEVKAKYTPKNKRMRDKGKTLDNWGILLKVKSSTQHLETQNVCYFKVIYPRRMQDNG